jgi:hypothetical protein
MINVTTTRGLCALAIAAAGLIATAAPAAAGTSLNPPPPSFYTCKATGSGTICHGTTSSEHFAEFDGTCPQGFSILENAHADQTATRYYDRDGNLTRRVVHNIYPVGNPLNVLYNSQTGTSVPYSGDLTQTDDLAVPGDFSSATSRQTGNLYTVTLPGGGLLVHDVGTFTFAPDGSILEDHGPKMLFSGQTDKLCAALA